MALCLSVYPSLRNSNSSLQHIPSAVIKREGRDYSSVSHSRRLLSHNVPASVFVRYWYLGEITLVVALLCCILSLLLVLMISVWCFGEIILVLALCCRILFLLHVHAISVWCRGEIALFPSEPKSHSAWKPWVNLEGKVAEASLHSTAQKNKAVYTTIPVTFIWQGQCRKLIIFWI